MYYAWCFSSKHSVLQTGDDDASSAENSNGKPFLWALSSVN